MLDIYSSIGLSDQALIRHSITGDWVLYKREVYGRGHSWHLFGQYVDAGMAHGRSLALAPGYVPPAVEIALPGGAKKPWFERFMSLMKRA